MARADIAYAQARQRIRQLESAIGGRDDAPPDGRGATVVDRLTIARAHLRECASAVAQQHPDVASQLDAIAVQAELLAGDLRAGQPSA